MRKDLQELQNLEQQVAKGSVPQFFLFHGEEGFLTDDATKRMLNILVQERLPGINFLQWSGETSDIETFIEDARNYPFLTDQKVFHCPSGEVFLKKKGNAHIRGLFETLFKSGLPASNILLISSSVPVDKSTKVYKFLKKNGIVIEFLPFKTYNPGDPERDDIYPYIADRVKAAGKSIAKKAFFELRKRVPSNLWALTNEIDKLIVYSGEIEEISLEIVREVTPQGTNDQLFDLTDAISQRDIVQSMTIFNNIIRNESSLLGLHGMLTRHIHQLFMSKQWLKKKFGTKIPKSFSYQDLSRTYLPRWNQELEADNSKDWDFLLKRHPFVIMKTFDSAGAFSDRVLLDGIQQLSSLEARVKSETINHQLCLEQIIISLCKKR